MKKIHLRSILAGSAVLFLALCFTTGIQAQSIASDAPQASAARIRYATVMRIRGTVSAIDAHAQGRRSLAAGDPVFVGERIVTDTAAEALFKTEDAGYVALRSNADFVAERFSAKGNASDQFVLRIFSGALRVVTGWIGHTNRSGARIYTPSATIGIRGTDHEPYVLPPELAGQLAQLPGTYDKVNRGGTTLDSRGNALDLDPGKVGFVRSTRTRGLLTLLLPVLLDKIPEFYVPGAFDTELDGLSEQASENSLQELELQRARPATSGATSIDPGTGAGGVTPSPSPAVAASAAVASAGRSASGPDQCDAPAIARDWLARFDAAVLRRDAASVRLLFAPEVVVQARILLQDGTHTELNFSRDELAQSAVAALENLTDYSQRRPLIVGRKFNVGDCNQVEVTSLSIEQGRQQGRPYRFEAMETYLLEWRSGEWMAVKASTSQR